MSHTIRYQPADHDGRRTGEVIDSEPPIFTVGVIPDLQIVFPVPDGEVFRYSEGMDDHVYYVRNRRVQDNEDGTTDLTFDLILVQ